MDADTGMDATNNKRQRIENDSEAAETEKEGELLVEAHALRNQYADMKREFQKARAKDAELLEKAQKELKELGHKDMVNRIAMLAWPMLPSEITGHGLKRFCADLSDEIEKTKSSEDTERYVEKHDASLWVRVLIAPFVSGKQLIAFERKFIAAWSFFLDFRTDGGSLLTRDIEKNLEPYRAYKKRKEARQRAEIERQQAAFDAEERRLAAQQDAAEQENAAGEQDLLRARGEGDEDVTVVD